MDIESYIKSGILERYAREELNEDEANAVDVFLAEYLELGEELEQIYIQMERETGAGR